MYCAKLGLLQMFRAFENGVLRNKFEPEMEKFNGEWSRQYKEKSYELNYSPNIISVTTSRIKRWTEPVAHMGSRKVHT